MNVCVCVTECIRKCKCAYVAYVGCQSIRACDCARTCAWYVCLYTQSHNLRVLCTWAS